MPWKLTIIVTGGSQRGSHFEFFKDVVLIGRSKRADLSLNDSLLDAEHCRIGMSEDEVEVEDLGSKDGTFVNQLPVQRINLNSGDHIQVGRSELEVHLEQVTDGERASAALYQTALVSGYTEAERDYICENLTHSLVAAHTFGFAKGEELLAAVVKWFEQSRGPDLVILDFKMPIINGINTAISLRAFERAYKRTSLAPIMFFCDPPESEGFRKVLSFCAPAILFPRQAEAVAFETQAQELIRNLRKTPVR
jgi:CheY-like chemotaxis protein